VRAARAAQGPWGTLQVAERGRLLRRLAAAITASLDELAVLLSREVGKPVSQARAETAGTARFFEYFSETLRSLHGETIPVSATAFGYTVREPYGVVGLIVPWNYPLSMTARALAPSLAAGNAVVIKPAELVRERRPRRHRRHSHLRVPAARLGRGDPLRAGG
jgi:aldehyde dehydrogenase (NAD+)